MSRGAWIAKAEHAEFYSTRGEKLHEYRVKNGFSRLFLANLIGVSHETVRRWEKGSAIRRDHLLRLEEIGIPKFWLYGGWQPELKVQKKLPMVVSNENNA